MKNFIKSSFLGILFIFAVAAPITAVALPQTAAAAPACEGRFLGIPPWYRGLTNNNPPACTIKEPGSAPGDLSKFIWKIVLNVVEMAIVATTYVTVFFILYGGFLFLTGGALPGQIEKGRKTILNAVIGLVICLSAIALTNLLFQVIK